MAIPFQESSRAWVYHFSRAHKLPHTRVDGVLRAEGILLHLACLGVVSTRTRVRVRADFVEWNRWGGVWTQQKSEVFDFPTDFYKARVRQVPISFGETSMPLLHNGSIYF